MDVTKADLSKQKDEIVTSLKAELKITIKDEIVTSLKAELKITIKEEIVTSLKAELKITIKEEIQDAMREFENHLLEKYSPVAKIHRRS